MRNDEILIVLPRIGVAVDTSSHTVRAESYRQDAKFPALLMQLGPFEISSLQREAQRFRLLGGSVVNNSDRIAVFCSPRVIDAREQPFPGATANFPSISIFAR